MGNEVRIKTSAPGAKQATGEIKSLRDGYDRLQKQGAKGLGIGIGAAAATKAFDLVGNAVSGVVGYVGEAVEAASDLDETISKSRVVFGDAADGVEAFGNTAADAMGMSKQAAIEAAASFGNVFKGVGIGQQKAASMSETLVKLAGDLASFNNIDPTEALDKLRSGLAGESEPLRSVGVFLTEAQVKAKGMQLGLADAHGELSEGAKILARYQLILDQTGTAQGDFARTSDGLANTQRRLDAKLEDSQARFGKSFEPVAKGAADAQIAINDFFTSGIEGLHAFEQATGGSGQVVFDFRSSAEKAAAAAADLAAQQHQAAAEAKTAREDFIGVTAATKSLSTAVQSNAGHIAAMSSSFRIAQIEAQGLDSDISGLSSTIDDELFGDAINAGNEAQLKQNISDLKKQRAEVKKNSPEFKILTGQIAEQQKALFDLHLEEAAKEGPQAAIKFLKQEEAHAGDAKDEIAALIKKYERLAALQGTLGPIIVTSEGISRVAHKKRAAGGPVSKGEAYTVGENGPETFVAPSNGTIIPTGASLSHTAASSVSPTATGMTWSGDIHVHVTAPRSNDPKVWGQVVGDAAALVLRQQSARLPAGARA